MKNQLAQIVVRLLKENNISFNKKELEFQIQSHPSYPSLHSITGVLNHFNIENIAAKVEAEESIVNQLPNCFIAQVTEGNSNSLVTVKKKSNGYSIYNGIVKTLDLVKEDFIKKFTGIIVAVEENETKSSSKQYDSLLKIVPLTLLFLISVYFIYKANYNIYSNLYLLLSLAGIIISIAIIKQELGLQTKIGDAFCSSAKKNKDCDAVLTSNGAIIFESFKLSDLSLVYFTGLLLASIVLSPSSSLLYSLSLISLPVVIYSIYYQYFVTKSWCFLCLTIGGILVLQGIIAYFFGFIDFYYQLNDILIFTFVTITSFLFWLTLKPYITEIKKLRSEKIKTTKFQRNFTIFETLLKSKEKANTLIPQTDEIVFGNEKANVEIVVITNPFCGYCKDSHTLVENILKKYENDVKITIRFNIQIDENESDLKYIVTRLYELYFIENKEKCLLAMHDIYKGISPKKWFDKFGKSNQDKKYIDFIKSEKSWCTQNNINFTPAILINGYSYPKQYDRNDLLFFIEDLIEMQ